MGQGEKVKDHVESEADTSSPSTSMEVEDSPAAGTDSHDDESKPLSKRRRLLQKRCIDVPLEDAIRAEIMSYMQCQTDEMDENPLLFRKTHVQ